MFGELAIKFAEATRVLFLVAAAIAAVGVMDDAFRHAKFEHTVGKLLTVAQELLALLRIGAVSGGGDDQGPDHFRMADTEVQRGITAHGKADDVRAVDAAVSHDVEDVFDGMRLAGAFQVVRNIGRTISPGVEGDAMETSREETNLELPASTIACEFVHEDDGSPGAS